MSRSLNGCWTCRLRRKKCDELRPRCGNCDRLMIMCLEYGNRPEYIDGGQKEKKKLEEIKNAIKATKIRKRLPCHSDTRKMAQYTVFETPLSVSPLQHSDIIHQPLAKRSAFNQITPRNSEYSSATELVQYSHSEMGTTDSDSGQSRFENDEGLNSPYVFPEDDLYLSVYPPRIETTEPNLFHTTPIHSSPRHNLEFENAMLMIHYIDHVLYIQFPFYNDALPHYGRDWLLSLLSTVKPIYYTALALSSYHKDVADLQEDETARFALYWENHTKALIELRHYINDTSDRGGVNYAFEVSFCILQLIFCEIFRGGDKWQIHLQAASSLITSLITLENKISTPFFEHPKSRSTVLEISRASAGDRTGPDDVKKNAIDTVVTAFVALDILSSASTRSPSLLRADHKHWLSNRSVKMHHVIGCDVSVMLLISQISGLEEWKKGCEVRGRLSIMELSSRTGCIETLLEDIISANLLKAQAAIPSLKVRYPTGIPAPDTSELNNRLFSTVFALAAITYLHVVVSGAHPELNEIQQSVSRTILLMKSLPDPRLLSYVVWPFCITGCLAAKELENELRGLAKSAGVSKMGLGGLWKSLKIMEDCWKARDQNKGSQDWTAAMSRLGDKVLLY